MPTKQVRKVLSILPKSWENKIYAITEARNLKILIMDEVIENIKTYKIKKHQEQSKKEHKKEKTLDLKATKGEIIEVDESMTYTNKRFSQNYEKKWRFQKKREHKQISYRKLPMS